MTISSRSGWLFLIRCCRPDRFKEGQALFLVIQNRFVHQSTAVDAFPGMEYDEEIGESLQVHQAFTLRTFHFSLLYRVICLFLAIDMPRI